MEKKVKILTPVIVAIIFTGILYTFSSFMEGVNFNFGEYILTILNFIALGLLIKIWND